MKEQLISFNTAKLAKEKGFKTDHLWYQDDGVPVRFPYFVTFQSGGNEENIITKFIRDSMDRDGISYDYSPLTNLTYYLTPTQSLLQKWLREKHSINVEVEGYYSDVWKTKIFELVDSSKHASYKELNDSTISFKTYEEALEAGLTKALNLI